jgi:hypothetical protein
VRERQREGAGENGGRGAPKGARRALYSVFDLPLTNRSMTTTKNETGVSRQIQKAAEFTMFGMRRGSERRRRYG